MKSTIQTKLQFICTSRAIDLMTDLLIKLNFQDPYKYNDAKINTDLHIEDRRAVRESTTLE
jgi:hypothetical protein